MVKKNSKPNKRKNQDAKEDTPDCTCIADPLASLPPELLPTQKNWKSNFRKVTCPGCGLVYWTNRQTDLCSDCIKK